MTDARHDRPPYVKLWGKLDGYEVWMVDGVFVRRNIDINFNDMDQHYHLRVVTPGEIWIDSGTKAPEIAWMARSGVTEARLMANGATWAHADGVADKTEKAARKNDPAMHARVKLAKLGDNGKLSVWLVKGEAVRDKYDIDYTAGGHGRVYPWCPKNEIWLDDATKPDDRPYDFLHELYEWNRMGDGLKYEAAHHEALAVELEARRHPERYKALLDAQMKRAGGDLGIGKVAEFRKLLGR